MLTSRLGADHGELTAQTSTVSAQAAAVDSGGDPLHLAPGIALSPSLEYRGWVNIHVAQRALM